MTKNNLPPPLKQGRSGFPWDESSTIEVKSRVSYPKISIVTPSYQQGEFLEETIRSVLMQNYPNLEYIVLDGGSTDGSVAILEHYDGFITHWASEADEGQTDAINKGLAITTGEIMGWLNSDDLLLPNALFHIAHTFMQDENTTLVTGLRKVIDEHSNLTYNFFHGRPTYDYVRHICDIAQETTYWHRSLWEDVGVLDTDFNFALDYDYWQRSIHAGYEFTLIPEYIGAIRVHSDAKSSTLQDVWDKELQRIYQRYDIAQNYEEAVNKFENLDINWRKRRRFFRDMRHSTLSNNARLLVTIDDVLRTPFIGTSLLNLHNLYRRLRGRYYE